MDTDTTVMPRSDNLDLIEDILETQKKIVAKLEELKKMEEASLVSPDTPDGG